MDIRHFSDIDAASDPGRFMAFFEHVEGLKWLQATGEASFGLLALKPGEHMVEIGCGPGTAVKLLRERGSEAVGVDASRAMVQHARRKVPDAEFCQAVAAALPFADHSRDGYRAERVYEHLHDPGAALREARRVLRPGGRIALLDLDYDLWAVDADDLDVTRSLQRAMAETVASPRIGRRLLSLLRDAGFQDVKVQVLTHVLTDFREAEPLLSAAAHAATATGRAKAEQVEAWPRDQRARADAGRLCLLLPMFLASGLA